LRGGGSTPQWKAGDLDESEAADRKAEVDDADLPGYKAAGRLFADFGGGRPRPRQVIGSLTRPAPPATRRPARAGLRR
jgi:hypothetical protein